MAVSYGVSEFVFYLALFIGASCIPAGVLSGICAGNALVGILVCLGVFAVALVILVVDIKVLHEKDRKSFYR